MATQVAGWWFDGGYEHVHFNEAIAQVYAKAVKHGNPHAIVTFNPGVKVVHYTEAEDYTAGELNEPFQTIPASRWLEGSQWHALTYLGSNWSQRDTRYPTEKWVKWVTAVVAHEGAITLDMGPNWDPQAGPIGALAEAQVNQVQAIQSGAARRPLPRTQTSQAGRQLLRRSTSTFMPGPTVGRSARTPRAAMIEKIIDRGAARLHPDRLQRAPRSVELSHEGRQPGPGFVGDPLRVWREVTAEHGVALYMHYSGVWDSRSHPPPSGLGGSQCGRQGQPRMPRRSSGPYADKLLIPQLRELAGEYGVDGAWVDGECWASVPDYSPAAIEGLQEATGIADVPRKPGDPHWFEFLEFNRQAFRQYLNHYIAEVKATNPEMQLCSNWAFTDHMPEAVCAPVDWISGDFTPEDAVNSARFSARYLAQQGKPWDLMAWSFTTTGQDETARDQKSAVQLEREAAVVLALGGGFQSYYNQRRDGSVPEEHVPVIAEVAKFCRARQAVLLGRRAGAADRFAVFHGRPTTARSTGCSTATSSRISGTLQALLEGQQVVDVVSEHHLAGRMAEYPLIVVAECDYLEPAFKAELVDYVKQGGNLMLIGPSAASLFAPELGVTPGGCAAVGASLLGLCRKHAPDPGLIADSEARVPDARLRPTPRR